MRFISATTTCRATDLEVFSRAAEEDRDPNLCRYGFWHLTGFAQRRKAIRHSASAWTQASRSSIAIAVSGYACDGGAFERRQHYRRRRKANSSPPIAFGTLRIEWVNRFCNLVAKLHKARTPAGEGTLRMIRPKATPVHLDPLSYERLRQQILHRDGWRCQSCGAMSNLEGIASQTVSQPRRRRFGGQLDYALLYLPCIRSRPDWITRSPNHTLNKSLTEANDHPSFCQNRKKGVPQRGTPLVLAARIGPQSPTFTYLTL